MSLYDEANNEIAEALGRIGKAIETKDENEAMAAITVLVGGALIDLRTIANAVSKLVEAEPVPGEIVGNADLTKEEWETIEALRRGDIVTVSAKPPNDNDIERGAMQLYTDYVAKQYRPFGTQPHPWDALDDNAKEQWRTVAR